MPPAKHVAPLDGGEKDEWFTGLVEVNSNGKDNEFTGTGR